MEMEKIDQASDWKLGIFRAIHSSATVIAAISSSRNATFGFITDFRFWKVQTTNYTLNQFYLDEVTKNPGS